MPYIPWTREAKTRLLLEGFFQGICIHIEGAVKGQTKQISKRLKQKWDCQAFNPHRGYLIDKHVKSKIHYKWKQHQGR